MKYYVTYPANIEIPWLTDSTVDVEADSEESARRKFTGWKNIRNCILVRQAGSWMHGYRHPMTALWEDSVVEEGRFDVCQKELHWLQWVEKQTHSNRDIDQYSSFIPRHHNSTWPYKLSVFCCTCGVVVCKEEGESGSPEQAMVGWWVKKYINYPGTIYGQSNQVE